MLSCRAPSAARGSARPAGLARAVYTWAQVASKWCITVYGTVTQKYKAEVMETTYPATLASGSTGTATIKYTNQGSETWDTTNFRLGTTEPRDRDSAFYTASWISKSRAVAAFALLLLGLPARGRSR